VEFGGRDCDKGVVLYGEDAVHRRGRTRGGREAAERRHGMAVGEEQRSTCGYGVALVTDQTDQTPMQCCNGIMSFAVRSGQASFIPTTTPARVMDFPNRA